MYSTVSYCIVSYYSVLYFFLLYTLYCTLHYYDILLCEVITELYTVILYCCVKYDTMSRIIFFIPLLYTILYFSHISHYFLLYYNMQLFLSYFILLYLTQICHTNTNLLDTIYTTHILANSILPYSILA